MSAAPARPTRDDVLDAFAVEPRPDRETLELYLRAYPDYARDLIDLSRELNRGSCEDEAPLSMEDQALIDAAWRRHAMAAKAITDPFVALSAAELREVARRLNVPRQVVTAFRERRVLLSTVPRRFLARLAEAVNSSLDHLETLWLQGGPAPALARSYKADTKLAAVERVSFERVLIEAGVPEEKRRELMADAG